MCKFSLNLFRSKSHRHSRKSHQLTAINQQPMHRPQVTINPSQIQFEEANLVAQYDPSNQNLISTPMSMRRTPLKRTPFMASNRSITSACTGLSYLPTDTPLSVRYINRKPSTNAIFSDSETPRSRPRRQTRHIGGSPYLQRNPNHHQRQQNYATLTLKRHHDTNVPYETSRTIYDDIDKLSTNENLRDFIQVLDSLAQEKFGGSDLNTIPYEKDSIIASSPTDTNPSITLDSGYQSTKQLMNSDEYAVVIKTKKTNEKFHQRQHSFSSIDNKEQYSA